MIKTNTRTMKAVAAVAIGFLIAVVGGTTASATTTKTSTAPMCVPRDAVAYQPAVYRTVHHDAVPETFRTVHHAAVTHIEWRYDEHDGDGHIWIANHTFSFVDENGVGYGHRNDIPEDTRYYERTDHTKTVTDVQAYDEQVGNGDGVAAYDEQVLVTPAVQAQDAVYCQIGLYIYKKLNPAAPAGWTNSGPQTFIASKNGTAPSDWYTSIGSLPSNVCGDGWGYQQDATKSSTPVDLAGAVINYPNATVGWPPIYADKHGELSALITVPECPPVLVDVAPTAPTVAPMCGPNNDTVTIPSTEGVTYSDTNWVDGQRTITATANKGYALTGTTSWTFTDEATTCSVDVRAVEATVVDPALCGPNNDVLNIPTTEGVTYSDTGWVDGHRTITATANEGYTLVGTSSWTFTDEEIPCPTEVKTVTASVIDPPVCGPNNDVLNVPTTEGVIYSDTGWVDGTRTITATAAEGFVLQGQTSWTFHDANTPCSVTPPAPTVVPICFPNNDTVTIPEVAGVMYSDTGWVDGKRTITASAAEGYTLSGETTWTFTDVPSAGCAPTGPVFSAEDPTALAFTGAPSNTGGLVALAIILITSGTALVARKVRGW
jgi:hypothetical protein